MNRKAGWAATAGLIAAGATYQYLIYSAAHGGLSEVTRHGLKVLPVLFLAWVAARSRHKLVGAVTVTLLAVVLYWADGKSYDSAAFGMPHTMVYLALAWLFGHTLLPGHEPLITSVARRVHGELTPEMARHTHQVTIAWTVFCVGQVLLSWLLYRYASLDAWSLFITVLNLPLLGLMFLADYLVRVLRFPHRPQASIGDAIRAFQAHHQSPLDDSAPAGGQRS